MRQQRVRERPALVSRSRMDDHPGGFVDDDHIRVFVDDRERNRIGQDLVDPEEESRPTPLRPGSCGTWASVAVRRQARVRIR